MNYFISRGGQQYGPYAVPDLQRYIAQGSIQYSDLARTETMAEWLPLSQLMQSGQPMPAVPYPSAAPVAPATPRGTGPIPPSLHWALVLIIGIFTGIFHYVWMFVQANFVKKIDPDSKATLFYILGTVAILAGAIVAVVIGLAAAPQLENADSPGLAIGLGLFITVVMLCGSALMISAAFNIRASMLRYYNTVEPINLRLSAVMTFFFNILYFQYHFTRIAKWKETGILYPQ